MTFSEEERELWLRGGYMNISEKERKLCQVVIHVDNDVRAAMCECGQPYMPPHKIEMVARQLRYALAEANQRLQLLIGEPDEDG